jgi:histidine triad (HIT) family protein
MIVIRDISPKAKVHILMIPKEHYADITCLDEKRAADLAECLLKLNGLQERLGISKGFRLVVNRGASAGQTVFHLHIHILSGSKMPGF